MPTKTARESRRTTKKTRERMRSRELGAIDVPVDNATYRHNVESIDELSDEQRDRTFRTNIHTYYYMASAAIAPMRRGSTISTTGLDRGARRQQGPRGKHGYKS